MELAQDAEFTAFVRAAQPRLHRTAYLICADWHRAQDIVQTALSQMSLASLMGPPFRQCDGTTCGGSWATAW